MNNTYPEVQNESKGNMTSCRHMIRKRFCVDGICAAGTSQGTVRNLLRRRSSNWYMALFLIIALLQSIRMINEYRSQLPDVSVDSASCIQKEQIPSFGPQRWSDVKLLIYMTTHLPEYHTIFLPCWKDAVQRLTIFQNADLMMYTSTEPTKEQLDFLPFRNITIKHYDNPGYHEGALQAMVDPFLSSEATWFDGYDWVIRVNMDVLIRRDTWLIQTMLNPSIDLIVMDCWAHTSPLLFQTDFFAFRPSAVDRERFLQNNHGLAETHFTAAVRHIYDAGRSIFVLGAKNEIEAHCRIAGVHSPILHVHELANHCPYYYNVTKEGFYRH